MAQSTQSADCWAWVLSPFPSPELGPGESFVRLRLVGPAEALRRTAEAHESAGGWASAPSAPFPPAHDCLQITLAGTIAQ
ncbi:MAG: hypothetical protein ACRDFT_03440, partial [bacterium]